MSTAHAYTIDDFCRLHRVGRTFTYQEIAAGRLKIRKAGRKTLIFPEDAAEWRESLPSGTSVNRGGATMTTKSTILRDIHKKCLDCSCYQPQEVKLCTVYTCALYTYRLGKDPNPSSTRGFAKSRVYKRKNQQEERN